MMTLSVVIVIMGIILIAKNDVPHLLNKLFGPPTVQITEHYSNVANGASFDHDLFDKLLKNYVDDKGWVDYENLENNQRDLDTYIARIADAPFDDLGRDQKLALLMNAYNAFTLKLILDYYPLDSIKDIPKAKSWDDVRWNIGGNTWSLNQIEHQEIRPKFREPRIHFALVCAAVGCPPLRNEAYDAKRLELQLNEQTRFVFRHKTWFELDEKRNVVKLTKLLSWYGDDFAQFQGSVIKYVAEYSSALEQLLDTGHQPDSEWIDYDWALNSSQNKIDR